MKGFIHSLESFGTVDGPGVRFVIFLQGCPMRCLYCHNPDTWEAGRGSELSASELIGRFEKNRAFYSNGGITVTGGEPLMQIDFLLELFALAKERKIHTCIDTSGITFTASDSGYRRKLDRLTELTDLVMLDVKHINSEKHRILTGFGNENILAFARYLDEKRVPVWIRHVLVPNITDDEQYLSELGSFMGALSNVQALDVLPYHTMGIAKYREMGIAYPLEGVPQADKESVGRARKVILKAYKKAKADI